MTRTGGWRSSNQCQCPTTDKSRAISSGAGSLLAVAYVLGSTDLHAGNVIAVGPDPIPVDLETIMGPSALRPLGDLADDALPRRRRDVLGTRLLPFWRMNTDGGGAA